MGTAKIRVLKNCNTSHQFTALLELPHGNSFPSVVSQQFVDNFDDPEILTIATVYECLGGMIPS